MTRPPVQRRELFAWAMYDFANSGYTTVVLTALFNAYFVGVVARAAGIAGGTGALLWAVTIGIANALVLLSGPVVGAMADALAVKKRILLLTTLGCVAATASLAAVGPGDLGLAMVLVVVSCFMFGSSDNLIAAFLPEIASPDTMGKLSGYGWSLGYLGGLLTLAICIGWIAWAAPRGMDETQYVPVCMLIVAGIYGLASAPTFLWLRERAVPSPAARRTSWLRAGFGRLRHTLREASEFKDLFRFLLVLTVYQSGVSAVVVLAAIYAREVMGFESRELLSLIMVVNVTAAVGAFAFGHIQDRIGSKASLAITLLIWIAAVALVYLARGRADLWIAGNLIGAAMGASQSAGRALVGQFTPPARTAEFFGLWGLAMKLAAIVGPLSYGVISHVTAGDHRQAILSTLAFFVIGLGLLTLVDEQRGRRAALRGC